MEEAKGSPAEPTKQGKNGKYKNDRQVEGKLESLVFPNRLKRKRKKGWDQLFMNMNINKGLRGCLSGPLYAVRILKSVVSCSALTLQDSIMLVI